MNARGHLSSETIDMLMLSALGHPYTILPGVLMNIGHYTRSFRAQLASKAIRIRFINGIVIYT